MKDQTRLVHIHLSGWVNSKRQSQVGSEHRAEIPHTSETSPELSAERRLTDRPRRTERMQAVGKPRIEVERH